MVTVLTNPAEMIERGAPHVIHNDEELEVYTKALFSLTSIDHPNTAQAQAIELLSLLIEHYESQRYPIPAADPVTVLRFLWIEMDFHSATSFRKLEGARAWYQ
jgi:HTH-type transcriptional regulator/antitoxin HigA